MSGRRSPTPESPLVATKKPKLHDVRRRLRDAADITRDDRWISRAYRLREATSTLKLMLAHLQAHYHVSDADLAALLEGEAADRRH